MQEIQERHHIQERVVRLIDIGIGGNVAMSKVNDRIQAVDKTPAVFRHKKIALDNFHALYFRWII